MAQWLKAHAGSKTRYLKEYPSEDGLADLFIFDVPEDLPVSGIDGGTVIPQWNMLPTISTTNCKKESLWMHKCFELATEFLNDRGAIIVFYPDSKFVSNELISWTDWADFWEEAKWFAINGLPLSSTTRPARMPKSFLIKCFVKKTDPPIPFVFNDRLELLPDGIELSTDGHLTNFITHDSLTLRACTGTPWRGAREKSQNLMEALIDLCSKEDDIVMDFTASTGASIRACKALKRHILAFETDKDLVEEVLRPLISLAVEVESANAEPLEEPSRKRPLEVGDEEPEIKTAPKRTCKRLSTSVMASASTRHVGVLAHFASEFVNPEQPHILPEYAEAIATTLAAHASPVRRAPTARSSSGAMVFMDVEAEEASTDLDNGSGSSEPFIHEGNSDDELSPEEY